jgi:hypothetical protein
MDRAMGSSGVRSTVVTKFIHRYMDLVLRRASKDAVVARTYMGVINLVAPPAPCSGSQSCSASSGTR